MADPIMHQILSLLKEIKTEQSQFVEELGKRDVALIVGLERVSSGYQQRDAGLGALKAEMQKFVDAQAGYAAAQGARDAEWGALRAELSAIAALPGQLQQQNEAAFTRLAEALAEALAGPLAGQNGDDEVRGGLEKLAEQTAPLAKLVSGQEELQKALAEAQERQSAALAAQSAPLAKLASGQEELVAAQKALLSGQERRDAAITELSERQERRDAVLADLLERQASDPSGTLEQLAARTAHGEALLGAFLEAQKARDESTAEFVRQQGERTVEQARLQQETLESLAGQLDERDADLAQRQQEAMETLASRMERRDAEQAQRQRASFEQLTRQVSDRHAENAALIKAQERRDAAVAAMKAEVSQLANQVSALAETLAAVSANAETLVHAANATAAGDAGLAQLVQQVAAIGDSTRAALLQLGQAQADAALFSGAAVSPQPSPPSAVSGGAASGGRAGERPW